MNIMLKVTYIERRFIDRYTCIDTERCFTAISYFQNGGLTYFKIDRFNVRVIETSFIKSIDEK